MKALGWAVEPVSMVFLSEVYGDRSDGGCRDLWPAASRLAAANY